MPGSALATLKTLYHTVGPLHEALGIPLASVRQHHGDLDLLRNAVACFDPASWLQTSVGSTAENGGDMGKVRFMVRAPACA